MTAPDDCPIIKERRTSDRQLTAIDLRIDQLHVKVEALTSQHAVIAEEVQRNTEITKRIDESTAGLVDAWHAVEGAFKVLAWVAKAARWFTIIAAAIAGGVGLWWSFRHGGSPAKVDIPSMLP